MKNKTLILLLSLILSFKLAFTGTTGKVTGLITDAETNEPLPGVNVLLDGTTIGAATDPKGYYVILNIPPGTYAITARMMGYTAMKIKSVKVVSDLTTTINFELTQTVLDVGEAVTITAERPLIQKDITSTLAIVGQEEIAEMPVQEFEEVLKLQAGIVEGVGGEIHFRGGRAGEVSYLVDGVSVTDPFNRNIAIEVENNAIQELVVVSGTFNAEYGQAMSGVVDIVTREGEEKYASQIKLYAGDYVSAHNDVFYDIDDLNPLSIQNAQLTLSGPVLFTKKKMAFFATSRYFYNDGWLYGQRRFNPTDSSSFEDPDPALWYMEETGDRKVIAMNPNRKYSFQGKLSYRVTPDIKITYGFLWDDVNYQLYNHLFKYNPNGNLERNKKDRTHIVNWNHTLSSKAFYTFKLSALHSDYQHYVFENPCDSRYVDPRLLRRIGFSFHTGGTLMEHFDRTTNQWGGKFEFTGQIGPIHQIKAGLEFKKYELKLHQYEIQLNKNTNWKPAIFSDTTLFNNRYTHQPQEFALYMQDKIELKDMIVNIGLRYDFFRPDGWVTTDARDPQHSSKTRAKSKHQLSPRLGIAYPITNKGVFHFSYGHFFQIPAFEFLYLNSEFEVYPGGLYTKMGNADLEPERTVIYEFGLQQQLGNTMAVDVTMFYKDIRNLLGTEIHELYIMGDKYAKYINRDYGNVRGFTLALERRRSGLLSATVDYTYQIAEGNASDPDAVFLNNQTDPPKEDEKQVLPLDWDQTHTLNIGITLSRQHTWGLSLLGKIGSGLPYTPAYQESQTSIMNSERKPAQYTFDLRAFKTFHFAAIRTTFFVNIDNLFDRKNERIVYTDTGRAGYSLSSHYAGMVHGPNTLTEFLKRPDFYSEPRQVTFGFSVEF